MHKFGFPTAIHFGAGVRKTLPELLKEIGKRRPLLVTDRGLGQTPLCRDLEKLVSDAGFKVKVFSDLWGNPVKSQVMEGAKAFRSHEADCVIGLGGGAALDCAKAIALMGTHPGDLFDYESKGPSGEVAPWIAVPTTSGTGSEVGRSAVISDEKTHIKKSIFSPKLLAKAVFADPELTVGLPKGVTATTGMDALTHCVESYLSAPFHPICDGIAFEGIRICAENLPKVFAEPGNVEARGMMMMASIMGGIAFQKDLGVVHSCAHALGTVTDMHHGLANGIMIDHALKFNLPARTEKFRNMAVMLGLKAADGNGFLGWLAGLKAKLEIPRTLTEAKVGRDKLDRLVEVAFQDGCHQYNPRPVGKEDFRKIFTEAF